MSTLEELKAELEKLKAENALLAAEPAVVMTQGEDMWGRPRAPLTPEERARFAKANRKNVGETPSVFTTEEDEKLSMACKINELRESIAEAKAKG